MIQKQPMMRKMLYALLPIFLFGIYLYGLRVIILGVVVFGAGILTEYFMEKRLNKKVSEAVLVTCALYLLSLPASIPLWIAAVGIIFGVLFAKEVFGGFGRNVFNPAITGRLFIYLTFPSLMTTMPQPSINNFTKFTIDSVTSATPLHLLKIGESVDWKTLLFGIHPGAIGESAIILILIGAIYLIYTKTANWKMMAATLLSALILSAVLFFIAPKLDFFAVNPLRALFSGSLLFITVFMVTDPISAPKNSTAQWIYGIIIGCSVILIRAFSLFPEGSSFAIIIGNTCAPLIDDLLKKKVKK